jgi:LemA protein
MLDPNGSDSLLPVILIAAPFGLVVLLMVWVVATYNRLVNLRNLIPESWSNVDTQLRRRYDLIPNLVNVVKGYAAHEREVMQSVVDARSRAVAQSVGAEMQAGAEDDLVLALKSLIAVTEGYPALKADQEFLRLQHELINTEDMIQAARRFYNGNVRDLNTAIQSFPSSIIARKFGFKAAQYFEVEELFARELASVRFG